MAATVGTRASVRSGKRSRDNADLAAFLVLVFAGGFVVATGLGCQQAPRPAPLAAPPEDGRGVDAPRGGGPAGENAGSTIAGQAADGRSDVAAVADRAQLLAEVESTDEEKATEAFLALIGDLPSLERSKTDPLIRSPRVVPKVLGLARAGWDGDASAVREIAVLALEYTGKDRVFASALDALFPLEANPELEGLEPVDRLARIRESLETMRPLPGGGWEL